MKFVVGIAHAAFRADRKASLDRLLSTLGVEATVHVSETPEHSTAWAGRLWAWAARQDCHAVLLNDDVEVVPHFHEVISALLDAVPGEVISLHAQGEDAKRLGYSGERWLRFYDYTGPGVVFPPGSSASALAFWQRHTHLQNVRDLNEDNVASQWAWEHQRPMWAPLPAPVKHDPLVPSTLGYDKHANRVTMVAWDEPWWPAGILESMRHAAYWRTDTAPTLIENPWFSMRNLDHLRRVRRGLAVTPSCVFCGSVSGYVQSARTSATLCLPCARQVAAALAARGV